MQDLTPMLDPNTACSLLLASNNFYREFTDNPVVTTAAQALRTVIGICGFSRPDPILFRFYLSMIELKNHDKCFLQGLTQYCSIKHISIVK